MDNQMIQKRTETGSGGEKEKRDVPAVKAGIHPVLYMS